MTIRVMSSSGSADSIPERNVSEPISPELVLVDPELARAERARLLALSYLETAPQPRTEPAPAAQASPARVRALEAQVVTLRAKVGALEDEVHDLDARVSAAASTGQPEPRRSPRHASSVVLPIGLIATVILIAVAVADSRVGEPSSVQPATVGATGEELFKRVPQTSARERGESKPRAPRDSAPKPKSSPATQRARHFSPTIGAVERKVLAAVVQSPSDKLPPRLIDRETGLAKNGLEAICRRRATQSFVCIVRPSHHKPTEGLYARYRRGRNGRLAFTWYRYRTG
jgi:hypothetical protein